MTTKQATEQKELLESNNNLLRMLQESETNAEVRVAIANQVFNNTIAIGSLTMIVVIDNAFTPAENKIDKLIDDNK